MVNWNFNKYLPETFKLALPGYQSMTLAWRQSLRSGLNQGQLIEDRGVDVDELAQVFSFFSNDQNMNAHVNSHANRISKAKVKPSLT
jgi:hypothetical protein